jgi:diguanylate cyclase (GGDEF)-like protein
VRPSASLSPARNARSRLRLVRGAALGAACLTLLLNVRQIGRVSPGAVLLLFGLILLSRLVPVALSREKPITFTAAFVFAAALLLNGVTAGASALAVCVLHARFLQRGGRAYACFLGAQYALAALAADAVYVRLSGHAEVSVRPGYGEFGAVCAAGLAFIAVNSLLVGLGNMGTRHARPQYAEPVLRAQALAYAVSFPFAALMVFAYRAFGMPALPFLAALLLICAHAVRMTVENRVLAGQLAAVQALGESCASGVRAETPLQRFLELARDTAAFERAVLWVSEDTSGELRPRAVYPKGSPLPDPSWAAHHTLIDRASHRAAPLLIPDVSRDPRQPAGTPPAAWMLHPLLLHGRCIGVAQFIRSAARPFTPQELQRIAALVPQAAIAFESVHVRHMMRRYENMAATDGLTGLLNHRRSQETLREEMKRAARYNHPLSVLMLDVDGFKQFNDAFGHPQGDVLLRSIAHILRAGVRDVDYVGRYGGEEFIILLPETARADACVLAERIRAAVENEWFAAGDGHAVQKTISIGVAAFPQDGMTPAELIQQADEALYRAKRSGKNRVLAA